MAVVILMLATGVVATTAAWLGMQLLQREYGRYRVTFQQDAVSNLADFFVFLDPAQLWGANVSLAFAAAGLTLLVSESLVIAAAAGLATLLLPRCLLQWARHRRNRQIEEQLPDLLLALAGTLRSGAGLQKGLQQVCLHTRRPLSQELGLLLQQQRMGVSLAEALDALNRRIPNESIALVVAAIKVAGDTGGSLADTLEQISRTLRGRLQLIEKIRALTSQGRMQAWIMGSLPALLIVALNMLDPITMRALWTTPGGWLVLGVVFTLEFIGISLVRRIVKIEV
ncbi:MAG TPA: type II secretion system F family protein [Burkholderiaceae bacterium]|nr:type II secretion system F family protein [Burkholderiaceae bacterium]